jgi:glycosyltransferase involved in cell wall biosynthesis
MSFDLRHWLQVPTPVQRASGELPLVSCIMPTADRRPFVIRAIQYFQRQDFPRKELIVVDDGRDRVRDLVAGKPGLRYFGLSERASLGAKRNLAVDASRGEIIVHWDDDDWYDRTRLSYQVAPLLAERADITALKMTFLYDLVTDAGWRVDPTLHASMFVLGIHTGSIAYRKRLWRRAGPFPPTDLAEDVAFLRRLIEHDARLVRLPNDPLFAGLGQLADEEDLALLEEIVRRCGASLMRPPRAICVYMRHRTNAWRFDCGQHLDRASWHRLNADGLLPPDDLAYYRSIASS